MKFLIVVALSIFSFSIAAHAQNGASAIAIDNGKVVYGVCFAEKTANDAEKCALISCRKQGGNCGLAKKCYGTIGRGEGPYGALAIAINPSKRITTIGATCGQGTINQAKEQALLACGDFGQQDICRIEIVWHGVTGPLGRVEAGVRPPPQKKYKGQKMCSYQRMEGTYYRDKPSSSTSKAHHSSQVFIRDENGRTIITTEHSNGDRELIFPGEISPKPMTAINAGTRDSWIDIYAASGVLALENSWRMPNNPNVINRYRTILFKPC